MNELPKRKPNRLKDYDYSQNGAYFVTICVKNKHEMFGEIINGQPVLNKYGLVVKQEIENISAIRKECVVEKFVVMPNHIHLIVQIIVGDDGNRPVDLPANRNRPVCPAELPADGNYSIEPHADDNYPVEPQTHDNHSVESRADCRQRAG